jgi:glycerate dehydrogenase
MPPIKIVFLDRDSLPVTLPEIAVPHEYQSFAATTADQVVERCRDASIVITNKIPFPAAVLEQLPKLKMLAVAATGVNHIDLETCSARGVAVANIQHYGDESVAEHAFLLMLALRKNFPAYQRDMADGCWPRAAQFCHFGAPIHDLKSASLGLIGSGGIGLALAERARAFGMRVMFAERKGVNSIRNGYLPFEQVLAEADVVSLHCLLTAETRNLISAPELARMKPGALLINTARGGLINEADLLTALQNGTLGGAGLDVMEQEPPSAQAVLLQSTLPNLIITPHIAWASTEAMERLAQQLVDNIAAFAGGTLLRRVA